jgi:integrase/recombinase XerD
VATSHFTEPIPVIPCPKPRKPRAADGVYTVPGRSGFRISYVDERGRRRRKKVAAKTLGEARKLRNILAAQAEMNRAKGIVPASNITLADLLKRYKQNQKAHWSASTFARIDSSIRALTERLPAVARDVRRSDVDGYISARGAAPATIAREITTLSHALKLAVEWELLTTNPAAGVKLPKLPPGKTGFLTEQQFETAMAEAAEWMRAPIAFATFTGMRRSELLGLRWTDVNFRSRQIILRLTKNGERRAIPLNDAALAVLAKLPRTGELCFPGIAGGQLSNAVRRLFGRLGFDDLSFHSLRHTHASWLVMKGADLFSVSRLLGHKSLKMSARYAHHAPNYLAGVSSKLDGIMTPFAPVASPDHIIACAQSPEAA